MASIPQILEPPSQYELSSSTPTRSLSRFRSLFQRRKSNTFGRLSKLHNNAKHDEATMEQSLPALRPLITGRSRSDNPRPVSSKQSHTSEGHGTKKPAKVITDPPPLAQTRGQAMLSATLETPTSFTEKPYTPKASLTPLDVSESAVQVKRSHKRTESGASSCSTLAKTFFLLPGPYILQYEADSEGDSIPEKILVLDRDSVAFASDAVPGRPWVLQVSKDRVSLAKAQPPTLRPSWSRLTLRNAEERTTVGTMLMIFDDSEELYTWLYAVRKEIEHLGGMEYRPGTEDDDQSWRDDLTRAFGESEDGLTERAGMNRERISSPTVSGLPLQIHVIQPQPNRASRSSSNQSSSSLDRLRDSLASDSYSSTVATSSIAGSVPSASPTCEHFPSPASLLKHTSDDLRLRAFSQTKGSTSLQSPRPSPKTSILERRKLSMSSLQLSDSDEPKARKMTANIPPTISGSPHDSAPSNTMQITACPEIRPVTTLSIEENPVATNEVPTLERSKTQSSARESLQSQVSNGMPKPKYSLFPSRSDTLTRKEPLSSPPIHVTSTTTTLIPVQDRKQVKSPENLPRHKKSRSRTVTLELRQHRFSTLLAAGTYDLPQRSPAVTDDMIMSNFGVFRDDPPASPLPDNRVPGLAELNIDLDFLKAPYADSAAGKSKKSESRRASSAKSISSIRSDQSAMMSKIPPGPPPAGPLPAVPDTAVHPAFREDPFAHQAAKKHSRAISTSSDGPPPAERSSSRGRNTGQGRSRSRSRHRMKSSYKQPKC